MIEFARHVIGVIGDDHAETTQATCNLIGDNFPIAAPELVVTPLACSLVGQYGDINFTPGSQLAAIFQKQRTPEGYHCNYGPNPAYRDRFESAGLRFTGFDTELQIRAMELPGIPFSSAPSSNRSVPPSKTVGIRCSRLLSGSCMTVDDQPKAKSDPEYRLPRGLGSVSFS